MGRPALYSRRTTRHAVTISSSHDASFGDYRERVVPFSEVVKDDDEKFIHVPTFVLTTEVKDGTLILGVEKGKSFAGKIPVYRITVADLRSLELNGSGEADAGKLDSNPLSVAGAAAGAAKLAGQADELTIVVSGSGACNAGALAAKRATVSVSGAGDVTVNASEALDAKVSGSGSVHYLGSPKLTKTVSGAGTITAGAR